MADNQVTTRETSAVQPVDTDAIYVPAVDIREDKDRIRLVADMAGVDEKSVAVTVENNVLTIEGQAVVDGPKGHELVGVEYGVGRYRRVFELGDVVTVDGIKARVQHGVLEVTIPKREEVKTRKIEISA